MTTIYIRSGTILARNVTARICGDPDPNREARSAALLARAKPPRNESWHKGLKTSGRVRQCGEV